MIKVCVRLGPRENENDRVYKPIKGKGPEERGDFSAKHQINGLGPLWKDG